MKKLQLLALQFALLLISSSILFAQKADDAVKDEELTRNQAEMRIIDLKDVSAGLSKKLTDLSETVAKLDRQRTETVAAVKKCNDDLYALIEASEQDVSSFREKLGRLESRVREKKNLSNDELADQRDQIVALEAELDALRGSKIALLPEFYDRIITLAREIRGLYRERSVKQPTGYTVGKWSETKDCLWNISGKSDIYGDPFQWPKIWQSNTDQIKNPDIIQPGMQLKVPPPGALTTDEQKAARLYYRKKRQAAQKAIEEAAGAAPALVAPEVKKDAPKKNEKGN